MSFRYENYAASAAALAFGLSLLAASATAADAPATLPNGLQRLTDAKVDIAYERPGADWTKYKTIYLQALSVPPEVRDTAPSGTKPNFGESYILRDQDVAELQETFKEITIEVFREAGFTLVNVPQPDTMIVAVRMLDITLKAPLEHTRRSYAGAGRTFSEGGGSMAVSAAFADSSGQVFAEAADRRYPAQIWGVNNRVTNLAQIRQDFRFWARAIRDKLIEKRGK